MDERLKRPSVRPRTVSGWPRPATAAEPKDGRVELPHVPGTLRYHPDRPRGAPSRGASLRQQAIAQNLANVNAPGYRRRDVDSTSALRAAWDQGSQKVESVDATVQVDQSAVMRADGSSVDVDTEAAAQAKNGLQYEAVSAVIKTRTAILRSAIGLG